MCDSISRSEEALIFLKRIELGEFNESKKLNFSELLHQKLEQTEELIMLKKIHLKAEIDDDIWLTLHPQLAEALLNNVISNCIRHNHTGGRIYIVLHKDFFHAHNSLPGKQDKQAQTGFITSKGLGVGLSIVQSICSRYKYKIRFGEKSNGTFRLDIEF
jgi:signal transduction histidine kinase